MRRRVLLMQLLSMPVAAAGLLAQGAGSISDPPPTYTIPMSHYDTSPVANFTGVGPTLATDHLFEVGWWYRLAGDSAEKFFPVPGSPNFPAGTSYSVTWANVDGRGFDALEGGIIENGGGPSGTMTFYFTLYNPQIVPITLDLFNMLDLDLAGTAGTDSAVLHTPNSRIGVADGTQTAEYVGLGASAFLVRPFGPTSVGMELSNASLTNFGNTGLPFAPGDFTAGFHWPGIVLEPGGSRIFTVVVAVNLTTSYGAWIFVDGFESGNTHVWSSQVPP